jgi:ribosomal protein S18 acetylase RimI-like enzyme
MVSALRVARHTERLDAIVAFYRDGLGLTEIGGFRGHDGYDGVFLEVPGTGAHLEFTAGGGEGTPAPHPESLLVLYPYWVEHGVTIEDPDGFRVVLVPERWVRRALVALEGDAVVGHLQLTPTGDPAEAQVKNTAVDPAHQGRGIGRALMAAAVEVARDDGRSTLVVATAAADTGNLRFYQRLGFRLRSVDRDAFTPATGYEPGLLIDGVELRDRVWLDRKLDDEAG